VGAVVVHRGLLRSEESEILREKSRQSLAGGSGGRVDAVTGKAAKPSLSEKLVRRLSAHRIAALQAEVACHPHIALVAPVHRLASRVICEGYEGSPINISATSHVEGLVTHASDLADAPAAAGLRKVREAWAQRLPSEPDALFTELLPMPQSELLSLLAVCVASTVGAVLLILRCRPNGPPRASEEIQQPLRDRGVRLRKLSSTAC
jgi:ParB family transcriptional regulator, chromosome partitioning protein